MQRSRAAILVLVGFIGLPLLAPRASIADVLCGNEITEGSETCDDGNNYGGDGCAANCTLESDRFLSFGTSATTQSQVIIQGIPLQLNLPLTGGQILTLGTPRTDVSIGIDGFTNFLPGEIPTVQVIEKNLGQIDPIIVTNVACACLRGLELHTCGGRPAVPGDVGNICTEAFDPCPQELPCAPTFGPGNSAAGKIGCSGISDLDYMSTIDHDTGEATFTPSGGEVATGAISYGYSALGTIFDGGLCNDNLEDERKGPDGIPCTDDDLATSKGNPAVQVQTTGTAAAAVFNANGTAGNIDANSTCGTQALCVTTATGTAKSCESLVAGDTEGLCLVGAVATLADPNVNDLVAVSKVCALQGPICPGDCNEDGRIQSADLLTMIEIALAEASVGLCPSLDQTGEVTVAEVVAAVRYSMVGCQNPGGGLSASL